MANCADESAACKKAREEYDDLAQEKVKVESEINKLTGKATNYNSTATVAGTVACATGALIMMSNPVGWVLGVGIGLTAAGSFVAGWFGSKANYATERLNEYRDICAKILNLMLQWRNIAKKECQNDDCVPAIPAACP